MFERQVSHDRSIPCSFFRTRLRVRLEHEVEVQLELASIADIEAHQMMCFSLKYRLVRGLQKNHMLRNSLVSELPVDFGNVLLMQVDVIKKITLLMKASSRSTLRQQNETVYQAQERSHRSHSVSEIVDKIDHTRRFIHGAFMDKSGINGSYYGDLSIHPNFVKDTLLFYKLFLSKILMNG